MLPHRCPSRQSFARYSRYNSRPRSRVLREPGRNHRSADSILQYAVYTIGKVGVEVPYCDGFRSEGWLGRESQINRSTGRRPIHAERTMSHTDRNPRRDRTGRASHNPNRSKPNRHPAVGTGPLGAGVKTETVDRRGRFRPRAKGPSCDHPIAIRSMVNKSEESGEHHGKLESDASRQSGLVEDSPLVPTNADLPLDAP